jgi:phenylalanyl-tRNA synthetase beta chain
MKIPLNWLRDYVDVALPAAQLIERLTFAGLEVAGTRVFGLPIPEGVRVKADERGPVWDRDKIFVAEITGVDKHPDADRLKLPTVTWGPGTSKQLVTGAPNVNVGDKGVKVVLALCGSKLFDGHSEERVIKELKPTKIRGIPSDAMVCSLLELGVSESKADHEGILLLEDDAPVGVPLADFMGEIVIEVDVLPNMARCLSMIGVAREVAALTGQKLKLPALPGEGDGEPIAGQVHVRIEDDKLSARYMAKLIRNVSIGPSPGWMQRRLLYAGMRPINNIVDITNFVMLEWGQPLHAFDYDVLVKRAGGAAPTIIVRSARPGEVLVTLDGQKRELSPENLVIADTQGAIALAGVMGGLETEVTAQTKNILLESANFDFVSIRRTFKQMNLPSEASQRFSRGIHPETVLPAARRAADLMANHAGGTVARGEVDCYPAPLPPQVVELKMSQVRRLLGVEFPKDDAVRILRTLEFDVREKDADTLLATTPTHRLDIQVGPADLIEDLVRIHGYDRLPESLLRERLPRQYTNVPMVFEERLKDLLVNAGLQQVMSYSLTTPEQEAPLLGAGRPYVALKNPISSERTVMRQSVLASVLEAASNNLKHTADVRLFEIGVVYLPSASKLPDEQRRLALVVTGKRRQEFWNDGAAGESPAQAALDFYDLKGIIESVVGDLHLPDVQYQASDAGYLHPGKSAKVLVGGKVVGAFGELHPRTVAVYKLPGRGILAGELDVEALQAALPPRWSYTPVPQFPEALRDIALVVDEAIPGDRIVSEIRAAGGELLRGIRLFDVYRGDSIPAGAKSLAFALSYQAGDRTLTDKEIDKAHKRIEDRVRHVLKAQIRGKE